ncbi:MAG: hypothetical protein DBX55_02545 [Verrucomicrobia bacterium]|nr:MAG: hypothetical protein DBX55_02545 [Verrucomicrobiota bacterium]
MPRLAAWQKEIRERKFMSKKVIAILSAALIGAACSHGQNMPVVNSNLQDLFDKAAQTQDKRLRLKDAIYFTDKPIKLDNRHSGLKVSANKTALISGGKRIQGWKKEGALLKAKADSPFPIFSLFVNGKRAQLATDSGPNGYYKAVGPNKVALPGEDAEMLIYNSMTVNNEDVAKLAKMKPEDLKRAYMDFFLAWYSPRYRIESITPNDDGKTSVVRFRNTMQPSKERHLQMKKSKSRAAKYPTVFRFGDKAKFHILNAEYALDRPGEFMYNPDDKCVYYFPRPGETAANIDAWYPYVGSILEAKGNSSVDPIKGLQFRNIAFQYGRHIPDFPDNSWRATTQAGAFIPGFVSFKNVDGLLMEYCRISNCDMYALELGEGVWNSVVRNCEIYDAGLGGIKVGKPFGPRGKKEGESCVEPVNDNTIPHITGRVTLENNLIYNYGRWNKAGCGIIVFNSGNNTVRHNTIFDGYYTGISVGWCWGFHKTFSQNNKICDNRIFHIGHGVMDDMGGIYTLGNAEGSVISGNVISDIHRVKYGAWGIYNDEGSAGYIIENNYVYDTEEDSYFQHYGRNNTVRNNVFVDARNHAIGVGRRTKEYPDELVFERNIVVYKSPTVLLRNDVPYERRTAKFDRNMYFNRAGEVVVGKIPFSKWQQDFGQDKNSIVADPQLDGYTPKNEDYKKIGFVPFSVETAGVEGVMKTYFEKIIKDYPFVKPSEYK